MRTFILLLVLFFSFASTESLAEEAPQTPPSAMEKKDALGAFSDLSLKRAQALEDLRETMGFEKYNLQQKESLSAEYKTLKEEYEELSARGYKIETFCQQGTQLKGKRPVWEAAEKCKKNRAAHQKKIDDYKERYRVFQVQYETVQSRENTRQQTESDTKNEIVAMTEKLKEAEKTLPDSPRKKCISACNAQEPFSKPSALECLGTCPK